MKNPLLIICFLISSNYYLLKALKDSMLITANSVGAEVIPFVKLWCLFPASLGMGFLFTYLVRRYPLDSVCKFFISSFLFVFTIFAFLIYPRIDFFLIDTPLQTYFPEGWKGMAALIQNWPFALFYVFSELWGSFIFTALLWGFISSKTSLKNSKKSFPIYLLAGNVSAIFAGPIGIYLTQSSWTFTLQSTVGLVLFLGLLSLVFFPKEGQIKNKESFSLLSVIASKHVLAIALMGFSFNVMINLSEVVWKQQLFQLCPHPSDYNIYLNSVTTYVGVLSACITLLLTTKIAEKLSWNFSAMVTPWITLVSGLLFFGFALSPGASLALTAFIGSSHICLKRSCRYTFYDISREMAYIPLKTTDRILSKSVICSSGSRAGRMLGSLLIQGILLFTVSLTAATPLIIALFSLFGVLFLGSVWTLGKSISLETLDTF